MKKIKVSFSNDTNGWTSYGEARGTSQNPIFVENDDPREVPELLFASKEDAQEFADKNSRFSQNPSGISPVRDSFICSVYEA